MKYILNYLEMIDQNIDDSSNDEGASGRSRSRSPRDQQDDRTLLIGFEHYREIKGHVKILEKELTDMEQKAEMYKEKIKILKEDRDKFSTMYYNAKTRLWKLAKELAEAKDEKFQ